MNCYYMSPHSFGLSRLPKIDAEDITNISIAEKFASFERICNTYDNDCTNCNDTCTSVITSRELCDDRDTYHYLVNTDS